MSWPAVATSPADPVARAEKVLGAAGFHHLPVIAGEQLAGILCSCDLRHALPSCRVAEVMTRRVMTVEGDATPLVALATMDELRVNALPVLWRGRWGIVTRGDLVRAGLCGRLACMACGGNHHVRRMARGAMWFCLDCLDPHEDPAQLEMGVGD